jgi:ATP-dependent 26S proteasome regulatory subunit
MMWFNVLPCPCRGAQAVVLPMTHKELFVNIGIKPPKGVLLYGPPGTGKTMLARACANKTNAVFLKLAGPQLVQMFIGDGAKVSDMTRYTSWQGRP